MDAENENGNLLAQAQEKARTICESYPTESNFWLITNDFFTKHNQSVNKNIIKNYIDEITTTAQNKSLTEVINRKQNENTINNHLYVISDMQKSSLKIDLLDNIDSTTTLFLIPLKANQTNNISIDSCWINSPIINSEQEVTLFASITNHSDNTINEQAVFLELNGKPKSSQEINLKGKEQKIVKFTFSTNNSTQIGEVKINNYPVIFDNKSYFILKKTRKTNIICINKTTKNTPITTLFANDTLCFNFKNTLVNNIDINALKKQDLIIINELENLSLNLINNLNTFVENGGSIVLFPPMDANLKTYNNILKQLNVSTLSELKNNTSKIDKINVSHPIYKNVFEGKLKKIYLPQVTQYYQIITKNKTNSIPLLTQENKDVFLEVFARKKGLVYLFNSPLQNNYNNFSKHAIFVPTLMNIATSSIRIESIYNTIGPDDYFSCSAIKNNSNIVHLKNKKVDIIPTQKTHLGKQLFYTQNQITENGIYTIEVDGEKIDNIAYNYSIIESKMDKISEAELEKWKNNLKTSDIHIIKENITTIKDTINKAQKGKQLWKYALILSLIFFAAEILFIKLIKS